MKLRSLFFCVFPFLLVSGCSNEITLKSTDGSKITIKKENASCSIFTNKYDTNLKYTTCRVNGVLTDLTGRSYPFTESKKCRIND